MGTGAPCKRGIVGVSVMREELEKRPRLIKDREEKRQTLIDRAFEAEGGEPDDSDLQGQGDLRQR